MNNLHRNTFFDETQEVALDFTSIDVTADGEPVEKDASVVILDHSSLIGLPVFMNAVLEDIKKSAVDEEYFLRIDNSSDNSFAVIDGVTLEFPISRDLADKESPTPLMYVPRQAYTRVSMRAAGTTPTWKAKSIWFAPGR